LNIRIVQGFSTNLGQSRLKVLTRLSFTSSGAWDMSGTSAREAWWPVMSTLRPILLPRARQSIQHTL
jgi:hypothetical protein